MNAWKEQMERIVIGFFMGMADVIPGVSGATVALIAGIYERFIESIKTLNIPFLANLGVGIVGGWILGIHVITYLLGTYPTHLFSFYSGLILASIVILARKCEKGAKELLLGIMGFVVAFTVASLQMSYGNTEPALWYIFISGILALVAMMLPGISGAMVLLIMGVYAYVIPGVKEWFYLLVATIRDLGMSSIYTLLTHETTMMLLALGAGAIIGIIIAVLIISSVMEKHGQEALPFFVGLIAGSLRATIPGEVSPSIIAVFFAGIACILLLIIIERKITK